MADNVTTQSTTPATLPPSTPIATVQASFSGDTVHAGVAVLASSAGAEGSRALTLVNPATSDLQTAGNASLASIDTKLTAAPTTLTAVGSGSAALSSSLIIALPGAGLHVVIDNVIFSVGGASACSFLLQDTLSAALLGPIYLEAVNGRSFGTGPIRIRLGANLGVFLSTTAAIPQSYFVQYHIES